VTSPKATYSKKNRISVLCIGVSVVWSILAILFAFLLPSWLESLNCKLFDWKMSVWPLANQSSEIVHVDVDDEAIKEYGQWPWDRALSAKMVKKLSEFGAKVVAFDVFFASDGKSTEGNEDFFSEIRLAGNVVSATGLGGLTETVDKPMELPQDRSRVDALYDKSWHLPVTAPLDLLRVSKIQGSALPLSPIIHASRGIGHITATPDKDGVYRKVPLLVKLEDRCIPSLSFSTLMAYWDLSAEHILLKDKNEIEIKRNSDTVRVPIEKHGMLLINWGKLWKSFKHYSAKDVLSDKPEPSRAIRYKDKIVIVAVTATGNTDFGTTPSSINSPLSRIHSHALNTILTRSFITRIPVFPWIALCSAILTMLFPLVTKNLSLRTQAIAVGIICLVFFIATILCFSFWSLDIALMQFLLVFVPAACASVVIRGASIEWQAVAARRALERYLPAELLERTVSRGINPDISPRRQELTILFIDMKGFSTLSETVDVEYVSRFLKGFFEGMTHAIVKHQGRIHQFLGDGFLAVFGDLVPLENHAEAAFAAALDMPKEMVALNAAWANSGIAELESGISIRIGINTGMVFVGDLGSDRRLEYTVVGSAVNIASRLQALAPPGGIMLTSRTRALLKKAEICQGPEKVRLKGFGRDTEVYTVYPDSLETS
jgi:adenylate cyclase